MKQYKKLLLKKFSEHGWELVAQDSDCDWWLEEYWTIRSTRANWGLELLVLFLVDPQFDGHLKHQGVWAVSVSHDMPVDRSDAERRLALVSVKSRFDQEIDVLLEAINGYRNGDYL